MQLGAQTHRMGHGRLGKAVLGVTIDARRYHFGGTVNVLVSSEANRRSNTGLCLQANALGRVISQRQVRAWVQEHGANQSGVDQGPTHESLD